MGKQFRNLKAKQREAIREWLFDEFCAVGGQNGRPPGRPQREGIVRAVYGKIEAAGIAISLEEVRQYYTSKISRFRKRYENAS